MLHRNHLCAVLALASLASGQASLAMQPASADHESVRTSTTGRWTSAGEPGSAARRVFAGTTADLALLAVDARPPAGTDLLPCVLVRANGLTAAKERVHSDLQPPCAVGIAALATVWHAPAAPVAEPPFRPAPKVNGRLDQAAIAFHDLPEFDGTRDSGAGALSSILIGLALLWAAGPLGRFVSGLEAWPRNRRGGKPG